MTEEVIVNKKSDAVCYKNMHGLVQVLGLEGKIRNIQRFKFVRCTFALDAKIIIMEYI